MTLSIGSHSLTAGTSVRITPESLGFTCDQDSNATTKYYPRSTDPYSDKWMSLKNVSKDEFDDDLKRIKKFYFTY